MVDFSSLDELLNSYWLRPETALWREIDIRAMQPFKFRPPSIDLGCGDGYFNFVRAGGRTVDDFDVYLNLQGVENFFSNHDVYDAKVVNRPQTIIATPAKYYIDVGFDHKANLLAKAESFDLYKKLVCGDANEKLPFADCSFNSVFSNILYWLHEPESVFAEIWRILCPGGEACLMLPNDNLVGYTFYGKLINAQKNQDYPFLERLDRGRISENIKHAYSVSEWVDMLKRVGFVVLSDESHLSEPVIKVWDVGLRPIFPFLVNVTSKLPRSDRLEAKHILLETIDHFARPLIELDLGLEGAFNCFIIKKPDS